MGSPSLVSRPSTLVTSLSVSSIDISLGRAMLKNPRGSGATCHSGWHTPQQQLINFRHCHPTAAVTPLLKCSSCYCGVRELFTHLPDLQDTKPKTTATARREREIMVYEATGSLCNEVNFFDYTGFPPEMVKGCKAFMDEYNDDSIVEQRMMAGGAPDEVAERVCKEVCAGFTQEQRMPRYAPPMPEGGMPQGMPPSGQPMPPGGVPGGGMPPGGGPPGMQEGPPPPPPRRKSKKGKKKAAAAAAAGEL